jgi:hypothetical protein
LELQSNTSFRENRDRLKARILHCTTSEFERLALDIFRFQANYNPVYSQYIRHLNIFPENIELLTEIPFLPIQFFKQNLIQTGYQPDAEIIFQSSGTTGQVNSRHALFDTELYESVAKRIFEENYGPLDSFHILALLPSYLERNNSSLVYMMRSFIEASNSSYSGFYLHNTQEMLDKLRFLSQNPDGKSILLLGVTFALLDLAEGDFDLSFLGEMKNLMIMDTGGMKGRRQELLREEVHDILTDRFGVEKIHSEYGMTELLSQGYSQGAGVFKPGFSMQILLREVNDPFAIFNEQNQVRKTGGINVIDLANLDSCSFIETQDLGRFGEDIGTFYVMGRFDNSDIRGCNLMVL